RAPNQWHYRSRAQWQYDSIRKRLGYFERGSRRVCDVAECAVLVPELQQSLKQLRSGIGTELLDDDARYFRAVVGNNGVSVTAGDSVQSSSVTAEELRVVDRSIHGEMYSLDANSFFQANADLLPQLIDAAIHDATGELAIELYCGVGLFTLPLARKFASELGVEDDADAPAFARLNLANALLTNTEIVKENVGNWLAWSERISKLDSLDFLLLDPPRTGAESRVIHRILELQPRSICYVSCDPATLARDLKKLLAGGFGFGGVFAFVFFPPPHHFVS